MLNKKEFADIRKKFQQFESKREAVIQDARKTINLSKQIIYALHRGEKNISSKIAEIKKLVKGLPAKSYDENIAKVARQEFVEAICFYEFVVNDKIPGAKELGVEYEDYLLGICDLTGELSRKAVMDIIKANEESAKKIHALVEEIYGEFLKLELRNGELRKKSDSIKWNLKRLDDLMYDQKMKNKGYI